MNTWIKVGALMCVALIIPDSAFGTIETTLSAISAWLTTLFKFGGMTLCVYVGWLYATDNPNAKKKGQNLLIGGAIIYLAGSIISTLSMLVN